MWSLGVRSLKLLRLLEWVKAWMSLGAFDQQINWEGGKLRVSGYLL